MVLEHRIQAITEDKSLRLSLSTNGGFGAVKYDLYREGKRGAVLTEKTAQELIAWAIAQVSKEPALIHPPEIDIVCIYREGLVLETLFNQYHVPRQGEMVMTERGLFMVVKVTYDIVSGRICLAVTEVSECGVGK
jgi:hypothetical protein